MPNRSDGFSYGVIGIGSESNSVNHVKHEYGHKKQLDEYGLIAYTICVAIPSYNAFEEKKRLKQSDKYYYSLPQEYIADIYGEVQRAEYESWADKEARNFSEKVSKMSIITKAFDRGMLWQIVDWIKD